VPQLIYVGSLLSSSFHQSHAAGIRNNFYDGNSTSLPLFP
jgi:hypothetical protein